MPDSAYYHGVLHHVTLEVTYTKTYKVKSLSPSHAEDIALLRASKNKKVMTRKGYEFVKAKPVLTKQP